MIMKLLTRSIILLVLATTTLVAQGQNITNRFFTAYDEENITVDNTVGGVAFTASIVSPSGMPYRAQSVNVKVNCASTSPCSIRMTLDGTAPTTTVGFLLNEADIITIFNYTNINKARFIRTGANSATLNVIYSY